MCWFMNLLRSINPARRTRETKGAETTCKTIIILGSSDSDRIQVKSEVGRNMSCEEESDLVE